MEQLTPAQGGSPRLGPGSLAREDAVHDTPRDLAWVERLGAETAHRLRPGDAVLLSGPLGAGKTTLARALIRAACGDPALEVPSPTFTLVQSYQAARFMLHHFDLWRLDGPSGLTELGWDEARAGVVLVEWPDRLGTLAPGDALRIELSMAGDMRVVAIEEGRLLF